MLDLLFFLISRLNNAFSPLVIIFISRLIYRSGLSISHSKDFSWKLLCWIPFNRLLNLHIYWRHFWFLLFLSNGYPKWVTTIYCAQNFYASNWPLGFLKRHSDWFCFGHFPGFQIQINVKRTDLDTNNTICSNYAQTMLKLCSNYAQTMLKLCSNYVQTMLKLCSNYAQTILKLCSNYVQTMLKLCSNYVQTMLKLWILSFFEICRLRPSEAEFHDNSCFELKQKYEIKEKLNRVAMFKSHLMFDSKLNF